MAEGAARLMVACLLWLPRRRSLRKKVLKRHYEAQRRAFVGLLLIGRRWWSV